LAGKSTFAGDKARMTLKRMFSLTKTSKEGDNKPVGF
jgi:hypothetical protein